MSDMAGLLAYLAQPGHDRGALDFIPFAELVERFGTAPLESVVADAAAEGYLKILGPADAPYGVRLRPKGLEVATRALFATPQRPSWRTFSNVRREIEAVRQ